MEKMTVKEICEKANLNYKSVCSYKNKHKELRYEQVIAHFRPDLRINIFGNVILEEDDSVSVFETAETTFKEICEKANINYNSARSYRSRHKVRDNAEVIIHFRPELSVDGHGDVILADGSTLECTKSMTLKERTIVGKKAKKSSVVLLQKVFDLLGRYGGEIETKNPESWWNLDVEVEFIEGENKDIQISLYKIENGDACFDPQFLISLTMDGEKIKNAVINEMSQKTMMGESWIDENDIWHGIGGEQKANPGLADSFDQFMHSVAVDGPYLSDPLKVNKRDKTLAD